MKRFLLTAILCMAFISTGFAEPFGDASAPEAVPSHKSVEVKVVTDARFVSVLARKSLFENVKVYETDNGVREAVRLATDLEELHKTLKQIERCFVFTGEDGLYLVEVTYFDPNLGIKRETLRVTIGPIPPVEMAVVTWSCDKSSVAEGSQVVLTARLNKPVDKDVTVTPNFGGQAVLLEDYTFEPKACCIVIPAGQVAATATITTLVDGVKEDDESVTLSIDKVTNAVAGNPKVCNFTILGDNTPPPGPDGDLEQQVEDVLSKVSRSVQNTVILIRQPDGNTIRKKIVHAIGQQYGNIAREAKNSPGSWDVATMVDESKVRVGSVMPTSELSKWLGFFQDLTKLQKELDTNDMNDWIEFFEAVETVLTSV